MKRRRKKTCQHCGCGFSPDVRNRDKQSYCGAPECRKESKRRSAARWREKNPDHHRGPLEMERVRAYFIADEQY